MIFLFFRCNILIKCNFHFTTSIYLLYSLLYYEWLTISTLTVLPPRIAPASRKARGESFYAIYYTTEFKYIGRGDAFIAPKAGTYTFKLWGSPGGDNTTNTGTRGKGGRGAYAEITLYLSKNRKIYAFVGSAGANKEFDKGYPVTPGGYNGGGLSVRCTAAGGGSLLHGASGGGATHISYAYNPIPEDKVIMFTCGKQGDIFKSGVEPGSELYGYVYEGYEVTLATTTGHSQIEYDNAAYNLFRSKGIIPYGTKVSRFASKQSYNTSDTSKNTYRNLYFCNVPDWSDRDQVIGIAGGGGAGMRGGTQDNADGKYYAYAGENIAAPPRYVGKNGVSNFMPLGKACIAANNNTNEGYAYGKGQYVFSGGGGGGGWRGGYAISRNVTLGTMNYAAAMDGNCYSSGGGGTSYIRTGANGFLISGADARLDSGTYMKPVTEGTNGYIKVSKN